ncbi:MAG: HEPN domain-containing protein [Dolichospermum sp. JUN01]|nr:HEPN domain-containing protein [Dolichospermum sp. JUN01]MBS9392698.1 HEPN domain-containing protein [Dolichospermum sp. OL01]MCO5796335.1 HEPN domain-containing protein [Dolichospermum sp. OL03]MCS6279855.1 HEPN domain-containing protein [Dolichospermum sp.]QSV57951.1 MAG: HEPN domain-containing protein [Dolichospermum sp. LBC05a]
MIPEQFDLLLKASQSVSAAKVLLENNYPDYAASRAYYGMFYIAQAFLIGEDMSFSSHAGVISAFGRDFARTGKVAIEFHRFLIDAQDLRNTGDYGQLNAISREQANEQIINAEKFIQLAENVLGAF